jgi:hypothetical protein
MRYFALRQFQKLIKSDLKKENLDINAYLEILFVNAAIKKNDLGHGLFKVRVARKGQGKSGGFRDIIFWEDGKRTIAIYHFSKGDTENVNEEQLAYLRELASGLKKLTEKNIEQLLTQNLFLEYKNESKNKKKS